MQIQGSDFKVGDRVTFNLFWDGANRQMDGLVTQIAPHNIKETVIIQFDTGHSDALGEVQMPMHECCLSFGGQHQAETPTSVFGEFWIEESWKTINGVRYGPYRLKRWRDSNGKKRSQYLGKAAHQDTAP